MSSTFDVAIVGAGIIGAACAEACAELGMRVALCDAGAIGAGTTAAAMGHIVAMDDSDAQWQLSKYSRELWRQRAAALPASVAWHPCGTLWLAENESDWATLEQKTAWLREHGEHCEVWSRQQLQQHEPLLSSDLLGALRIQEDAVLYPPTAALMLANNAAQLGATVAPYKAVTQIDAPCIQFADGDRWHAKHIVIAAGLASKQWCPELKLVARKGHLLITPHLSSLPIHHQLVELGYLHSAHGHQSSSVAFNVQPRPTSQLILGSSRQFDSADSEVELPVLTQMIQRAKRFIPAIEQWPVLRTWTGFRPCTPDNLPYIGQTEHSLWVAAGHEGLGITTSLATAALLAAQIGGQTPAIDPTPFYPTRHRLTEPAHV
ncbi:NAD(P)/FAD-dependent oxidoreductase [Permianibacter aggregans]|uniref:Glycine/D-amino acid oxidase-like deaminating enzyme n=1 Tax=Permianibacter aggregans TaxID=1510150 RepID=A0A4V3D6Z0_9GAMM|nr:FAD-dependent oxidoreductase [Permianibacter aggregans]QGX41231.1 FAD-binding oxidoreductase [Permianibacter aggregans]TDQ45837.1 glycine/D-amino acid oxidase-like deaminating enzyme [Permianibacter aggregans]